MKKLVMLFAVCALLAPAVSAASADGEGVSPALTRGAFIQTMYDMYVEHSGMTVRQEEARGRRVPPGAAWPGGFGTCFYFDDIDFSGPLYDATGWASIHKISNGTGPGEYNINVFSPDQEITIQEAITMAYRLVESAGNLPELSETSDVSSAPAWAQDALRWWDAVRPGSAPVVPADPCNADFAATLLSTVYRDYVISFAAR